jgi:hypothetical protein
MEFPEKRDAIVVYLQYFPVRILSYFSLKWSTGVSFQKRKLRSADMAFHLSSYILAAGLSR